MRTNYPSTINGCTLTSCRWCLVVVAVFVVVVGVVVVVVVFCLLSVVVVVVDDGVVGGCNFETDIIATQMFVMLNSFQYFNNKSSLTCCQMSNSCMIDSAFLSLNKKLGRRGKNKIEVKILGG